MTQKLWPALALEEWEPTYRTLHRWSQIVGKIRLALCQPVNHWWHTSLRFNARGLTTTLMPHKGRQLEMSFDFIDHKLIFSTTDGVVGDIALRSMAVADFFQAVLKKLDELEMPVSIWPMPVEIKDPVAFDKDFANATYNQEHIQRMWTILSSVHDVFTHFRGRFVGKSSPIHLFWGAFDVALTRFSGRPNPHPPPGLVNREAYSHEVISHGFWFGGDWPLGGRMNGAVFYAYSAPEPKGFSTAPVSPQSAAYEKKFGEFLLRYDDVRQCVDPASEVLSFMQSSYEAGATLGRWDRNLLEKRVA